MTVSVFLGGFGFGNLGDEACLATSYELYKSETNAVFSVDQKITKKAAPFDFFFNKLKDVLEKFPKIDKVVLAGGGLGFMPSFRDNLDWAMWCKRQGAAVYVHNIGMAKIGREWADSWPYLVPVLAEAKHFSVRDFRSRSEVLSWELGLDPIISYYPERKHPVDTKLSKFIPEGGPYLGISINNRDELWAVIRENVDEIRSVLGKFSACKILPIVSTIHSLDGQEHDNVGFQRFAEMFDLEDRIVLPQACDYQFWRENIGPGDVKYMVSRCCHLLSARKHNIIHAIGSGVPFTGLFEFDNDSIPRVYQTLFGDLPTGSSLFPLYPF